MRESKFRAWDKKHKIMVYLDRLNITGDSVGWVDDEDGTEYEVGNAWKDEAFPLMQFTGLHDKNGKDVFEGDIVRHTADPKNPSPVIYHRGAFQVGNWPIGSFHESDIEVIGNTWES